MRWDNLFDDLESQLEQELTMEEIDLHAEEERLRLARLSLRDRILSLCSAGRVPLRLALGDGTRVAVTPDAFGRDWLAGQLDDGGTRTATCVVPLDAVAGLILQRDDVVPSLSATGTTEPPHSLSARLGFGFVLRDLCRRRQQLEVRLAGAVIHGTLDRVGRDHCDLAVHEAGGVRRQSAVTEHRVIRLDQILLVRL